MRKYRKWVVTLGLFAAAPNVGLAGPFDLFQGEPKAQADGMSNQQVAEAVASQLKTADLQGADVKIKFVGGTLTLTGQVADQGSLATINRMVSSVPGVQKVDNQMTVANAAKTAAEMKTARPKVQSAEYEAPGSQSPRVRQASGSMPAGTNGKAPRRPVTPVAYMQDEGAPAPAAPPAAPPVAPRAAPAMAPPGAYPAPAVPPGAGMPPRAVPPAPPAWAHGGAAATGAVYDQPALPKHAWPSYSAYPNYASLTYPRQHSASAWPYIGPYYPYPQVPLGWREVSMEWDDGHWHLDFNDRTDKWWWFMNPKKW